MTIENPAWATAIVSFAAVAIGQLLRKLVSGSPTERPRSDGSPRPGSDGSPRGSKIAYRLGRRYAKAKTIASEQMRHRRLPPGGIH